MKDFNELISRDKITLVDFYATWCGPCRTMHPILDKLKMAVGEQADILKIDIDDPENALIVSKYTIRSVPTIIIFRAGSVQWRGSGVVSAEHLAELIGKLSGERAEV